MLRVRPTWCSSNVHVNALHKVTCGAFIVWVVLQVCYRPSALHQSHATVAGSNAGLQDGPVSLPGSGGNSGSDNSGSGRSGVQSLQSSPSAQQLVEWLQQHNAVVNVTVAYAGPNRGNVVLARHSMTRGDVLAAIPTDLCWILEKHGAVNGSLEFGAVNLLAEMSDPRAFWRPFFDTLPGPNELLCPLVSMPEAYMALLQHEQLERYLQGYHARIDGFWREVIHPNDPKIPLAQYRYARSMLVTRMFNTAHHGNALVPLMHFANHAPDCPNFHTAGPCPNDPSRTCMIWMAGTYLAPGDEVCISYKYMPNDKTMLQYGFLQEGPIASHLHLLDSREFNATNMWSLYEDSQHGPPLFNGTQQELWQEVTRLSQLLGHVSAGDAAAAATAADSGDAGGRLLSLLLRWRQQRKAVLQAEVERLRGELHSSSSGSSSSSSSSSKSSSDEANKVQQQQHQQQQQHHQQQQQPEDLMLQWLQNEGGVVGAVQLAHSAAAPSRSGLRTAAAVREGDVLVAVPLRLAVPFRATNKAFEADVSKHMTDMRHPRSPRAVYFATLFNATRDQPASDTAASVRPRLVHIPQKGSFLVPVISEAQRQPDCPHKLSVEDCCTLGGGGGNSGSSSSSSLVCDSSRSWCVVLRAGIDLQPGCGVCIGDVAAMEQQDMLEPVHE